MNEGDFVAALLGAAVTAISGLLVAVFAWPKTRAQARKANAEASNIEWTSLKREVDRLSALVEEQGAQIAELKEAAGVRESRGTELENDNRLLRSQVSSLRRRVCQLEEIIKTRTTPEDMLAQLAEFDRKTRATP